MTLEQTLASVLCAAAEREWRQAAGTHGVTRRQTPRVENARRGLRVAGMLARHYDLLPEPEEYDDDGADAAEPEQ